MISTFEPYYAVIFTSARTEGDNGYSDMSKLMEHLAKQQVGYMGMESARNDVGITVSYWKDLEAIHQWKLQTDHLVAQQKGRSDWYTWYQIRICKVEREYGFQSDFKFSGLKT